MCRASPSPGGRTPRPTRAGPRRAVDLLGPSHDVERVEQTEVHRAESIECDIHGSPSRMAGPRGRRRSPAGGTGSGRARPRPRPGSRRTAAGRRGRGTTRRRRPPQRSSRRAPGRRSRPSSGHGGGSTPSVVRALRRGSRFSWSRFQRAPLGSGEEPSSRMPWRRRASRFRSPPSAAACRRAPPPSGRSRRGWVTKPRAGSFSMSRGRPGSATRRSTSPTAAYDVGWTTCSRGCGDPARRRRCRTARSGPGPPSSGRAVAHRREQPGGPWRGGSACGRRPGATRS